MLSVNTEERLSYDDVVTHLSRIGLQYLADAVRLLEAQAMQLSVRHTGLQAEYARLVSLVNDRQRSGEPPASYKPGPMSDG